MTRAQITARMTELCKQLDELRSEVPSDARLDAGLLRWRESEPSPETAEESRLRRLLDRDT